MHPDKTRLIFGEFLARGAERRVRWNNGFLNSPVVEGGFKDSKARRFWRGDFLNTWVRGGRAFYNVLAPPARARTNSAP